MSFCEYCLESPCVCTIDANALAQAMLRSSPRIGSLFSGYGGLDMGVQAALGGSVAWHVEFDKAPSKILAHHWPDVPNYGDVTAVDWLAVEPVDIITGGSPCQDLSHAGKRQGMTEGTRSNLWVAMREAIAQLRPSLVVWENVRGAYSAAADSEVEPCAGCVGERPGVSLRALGRVLGDLSDLGYDCRWHGLRAADVGAPHGRFRVFVIASDARSRGWDGWAQTPLGGSVGRTTTPRRGALLPSPRTSDTNGAGHHGDGGLDLRTAVSLLPTPGRADGDGGHLSSEGHQTTLPGVARDLALMPTPRATDGTKGGPNQRGSSGDLMLPSAVSQLTPGVNAGPGNEGRLPSAATLFAPTPDVADDAPNEAKGAGSPFAAPAPGALLPTPAVNDMGEGKTPEAWDEWTAKMQAAHGNGNGHGKSLAIEAQRLNLRWVDETPPGYVPPHTLVGDDTEFESCPECGCIWDDHDFDGFCMGSCGGNRCNGRQFYRQIPDDAQRLLPTTRAGDSKDARSSTTPNGFANDTLSDVAWKQEWGIYADAIARWEALTRPAPAPTQPSKKGTPQLSASFSEWLMGLPEGHVTDVPGLSRNDMLKALGNGVVWQQAAAAIRFLLSMQAVAA